MAKCALDEIRVGMILEQEVKDRSGRVLLATGTEVTAKSIQIFKTWGVSAIEVMSAGASAKKQSPRHVVTENERAESKATIASLFKYYDLDDPISAELMAECLAARLRVLERS